MDRNLEFYIGYQNHINEEEFLKTTFVLEALKNLIEFVLKSMQEIENNKLARPQATLVL